VPADLTDRPAQAGDPQKLRFALAARNSCISVCRGARHGARSRGGTVLAPDISNPVSADCDDYQG